MNRLFLVMMGILVATQAFAPSRALAASCDNKKASAADDAVSKLKGIRPDKIWNALHESFLKYKACDDGSIAEGFSDTVVENLANSWQTLPQLEKITQKDPAFRKFVLNHIDSTTNPDSLKAITSSATHCPANSKTFCSAIAHEAKAALADH